MLWHPAVNPFLVEFSSATAVAIVTQLATLWHVAVSSADRCIRRCLVPTGSFLFQQEISHNTAVSYSLTSILTNANVKSVVTGRETRFLITVSECLDVAVVI